MKKNHHNPSTKPQRNETKNKQDKKTNSKTPKTTNEDLGTMKIGKAHSMNDDKASISFKERK
ncbi:MAG TPA: hypothetical protein VHZ50_15435 [Puia sp.]|jgi:hypothetical protein|nr:hypothetical protein [Puia sp.]